MRKALTIGVILWVCCGVTLAQSTIWVGDAALRQGIPLARVTDTAGTGLIANLQGLVTGLSHQGMVRVVAAGYQTYFGAAADTVFLKRSIPNFEAGTPTAPWIKKFLHTSTAMRGLNNPDFQQAYSYTSYNKNKIELVPDSQAIANFPRKKWNAFAAANDLLLLESKTTVYYQRPGQFNEVVDHAKVSGFQDPSVALLATRYQTFNFYKDFVYCFGKNYTSPLAYDALGKYHYFLMDSIFDQESATTKYIFYFEPTSNPHFDAFQGEIIIEKASFAICGIFVVPYDHLGLGLFVQQAFEKFPNQLWFPTQQEATVTVHNLRLLGYEVLLRFSRTVANFHLLESHPPGTVTVPDVRIGKQINIPDSVWELIRIDSLTEREATTATTIDSIGGEFLFDSKLNWVKTLSTAQVRAKFIDLDLGRFVNYNYYEQVRLGAGGYTNERLLRNVRVGGWFGYGFHDQIVKYGYSASAILNTNQQLILTALYDFDLHEAGGVEFMASSEKLIPTSNTHRRMFIRLFDRVGESRVMLQWHPLPNVHTRFFFSNQNRFVLHDYRFLMARDGVVARRNGFETSQIGVSLEWRPNDRYFQGAYMRRTIKKAKPILRVQLAHSFKGVMNSDFEFTRFDFQWQQQYQSLRWGLSSLEVSGGLVLGDVPYPYLYTGRSNFVTRADNTRPPMVSDPYSFETMRSNEFLSNRFFQVFLRHNFQKRLFKVRNWAPHLELVARAMIGDLNNTEKHTGLIFLAPSRGFYEAGVEFNKLWAVVGVGVYYRFGAYAFNNSVDNLSLKINIRLAN